MPAVCCLELESRSVAERRASSSAARSLRILLRSLP